MIRLDAINQFLTTGRISAFTRVLVRDATMLGPSHEALYSVNPPLWRPAARGVPFALSACLLPKRESEG